jgi:ethanolamine ammonia-lyase small subunit
MNAHDETMDVDGVLDLARAFDGLFFETGQGSEVTNGTADGVDMGTLEARSYGLARHIEQQLISDDLNANAVNEHLRMLLPELRRALSRDYHVGDADVVVQNGRVRAGYEIGGLVGAAIVVHIIGERPGTGINTLSAYLTYGHDENGLPRWSRALDHAATTAVCGIHPKGKRPETACVEIARVVRRITEQRRSGVALTV